MNRQLITYCTAALFVFAAPSLCQSAASDVVGTWMNEDETAKISVYACGEEYCGKFVWMKNPVVDKKNPDPDLRDRAMTGVEVMTGFAYNGAEWTGGSFYLARRGKPAKASWKLLAPDQLELTVKVMGSRRSQWTRTK